MALRGRSVILKKVKLFVSQSKKKTIFVLRFFYPEEARGSRNVGIFTSYFFNNLPRHKNCLFWLRETNNFTFFQITGILVACADRFRCPLPRAFKRLDVRWALSSLQASPERRFHLPAASSSVPPSLAPTRPILPLASHGLTESRCLQKQARCHLLKASPESWPFCFLRGDPGPTWGALWSYGCYFRNAKRISDSAFLFFESKRFCCDCRV